MPQPGVAMAAFAEPVVRIRLPPAVSPLRTWGWCEHLARNPPGRSVEAGAEPAPGQLRALLAGAAQFRAVLVFRECEPAVAIVAVTLDLIASGFAENALDLAGRNPIDLCHLRIGHAIPHPSSDGAKLRTRNFARRRQGNDRSFRLGSTR